MKKLVLFLSLFCVCYYADAQTRKPKKKKATSAATTPPKDSNEYYINKAAQAAIDSMKARHLIVD